MLSGVGKIYADVLVDRVHRVTKEQTGDEQGSFRCGRESVNKVFTLKQLSEKI